MGCVRAWDVGLHGMRDCMGSRTHAIIRAYRCYATHFALCVRTNFFVHIHNVNRVQRVTFACDNRCMTTNTNTRPNNIDVSTRRNASHANCDHDNSKNARAKCRREMRLLNTRYDELRRDVTNVNVIDANALKMNARANNDENQLSIDDIDVA